MSDRGLPTEGAPACPFVAFEDDRDGRSTAPDHRHRCFAEARPAPRALAHQEAYCLSSAFPVCPTFQDWARREAAAARPAPVTPPAPRDDAPQGQPPPVEREVRQPSAAAMPPAEIPPRRSSQRDWAAPPPWSDEDAAAAAGVAAAGAAAAAAASGAGTTGAWDVPAATGGSSDPGRQSQAWDSESRGLAGSAAYRLAGPDPSEPEPARPEAGFDDDLDDAWNDGVAGAGAAGAGAGAYAAGAYAAGSATARPPAGTPRDVPPPRRYEPAPRPASARPTSGSQQAGKPAQQDASELFGPAWERPRRYEAYPSLRTRMGLPGLGGVPRVAIWALILLLAALVVFLFGPSLLGLGGGDGAGGASPTPAATEQGSAEPSPTEPPAPTPQVYVVAKGDTMSKIAKKFGVTIEELMAANPQIKNPNKISIGDEITIPVPVEDGTTGGGDGSVAGESQAP